MTQGYRCDETEKETKNDSNLFSDGESLTILRKVFSAQLSSLFKPHLRINRSSDDDDHCSAQQMQRR